MTKRAANCTSQDGAPAYPPQLPALNLATNLSVCDQYINPACIRALYGLPANTAANTNNSLAIFELDAGAVQSDMDLFFQYIATNVPVGTRPQIDSVNNATIDNNFKPGVEQEANLDSQLAWPLVYPLNIALINSDFSTAQIAKLAQLLKGDPLRVAGLELLDPVEDILGATDGSFCTKQIGPNVRHSNGLMSCPHLTGQMKASLPNVWRIDFATSS